MLRKKPKFRASSRIPSLPPRHPLEQARIQVENAILLYQAMIHLESNDQIHHKTMPVPKIIKLEASAHSSLSDVLRLQSSLCSHRSKSNSISNTTSSGQVRVAQEYLSARGETATELFEMATEECDVSQGMAGAIGDHVVEAEALRALSDIADMRHLHDVAEHRLERALDLLRLLPEKERESERVQKVLARMNDKKRCRSKKSITRRKHLLELRRTLGVAAMEEEKKMTSAFVDVVMRRQNLLEVEEEESAQGEEARERAKKGMINIDGLFEITQRLQGVGTTPFLSEEELFEAMAQINSSSHSNGAVPEVTEDTMVGLEEVIVWWLDGL